MASKNQTEIIGYGILAVIAYVAYGAALGGGIGEGAQNVALSIQGALRGTGVGNGAKNNSGQSAKSSSGTSAGTSGGNRYPMNSNNYVGYGPNGTFIVVLGGVQRDSKNSQPEAESAYNSLAPQYYGG
ncbi:MAG: hypothetical protein EPO21_13115 [Chloroflexota bacterium]|nr:MAG: hypothetical protein EPO21_13115 [Chloroflexota bacterium]